MEAPYQARVARGVTQQSRVVALPKTGGAERVVYEESGVYATGLAADGISVFVLEPHRLIRFTKPL